MKKIILAIVLGAAIAVAVGFYLYNKPSEFESNGTPDHTIALEKLLKDCQDMNKADFDKTYVGKSVQFSQEVTVAEVQDVQGAKTLAIESGDESVIVNAGFHESVNEKIKNIVAGDKIKIQCDCSGVEKPESEDDLISETVLNLTRCNLMEVKK